jgi:hypothetical protein
MLMDVNTTQTIKNLQETKEKMANQLLKKTTEVTNLSNGFDRRYLHSLTTTFKQALVLFKSIRDKTFYDPDESEGIENDSELEAEFQKHLIEKEKSKTGTLYNYKWYFQFVRRRSLQLLVEHRRSINSTMETAGKEPSAKLSQTFNWTEEGVPIFKRSLNVCLNQFSNECKGHVQFLLRDIDNNHVDFYEGCHEMYRKSRKDWDVFLFEFVSPSLVQKNIIPHWWEDGFNHFWNECHPDQPKRSISEALRSMNNLDEIEEDRQEDHLPTGPKPQIQKTAASQDISGQPGQASNPDELAKEENHTEHHLLSSPYSKLDGFEVFHSPQCFEEVESVLGNEFSEMEMEQEHQTAEGKNSFLI